MRTSPMHRMKVVRSAHGWPIALHAPHVTTPAGRLHQVLGRLNSNVPTLSETGMVPHGIREAFIRRAFVEHPDHLQPGSAASAWCHEVAPCGSAGPAVRCIRLLN
jgi:hypothetical protein